MLTNPPFGGKEEDGIEANFPKHFQTRETADLFLALIVRLLKPGGRAAVVLPDGTMFGEGVKTRLKEHLLEACQPPHRRAPAQLGLPPLFLDRHQPAVLRERRADAGHLVLGASRARRPESLFDDKADPAGASGRLRRFGGRGPDRAGREEGERAWKVSGEAVKERGYNLDIKNPHTAEADLGDPEELLKDLTAAEAEVTVLRNELKGILAGALVR